MEKIVNRDFKGLTFTNGRYKYEGDLYIYGDTAIDIDIFVDGDLVVGGNLTTNKDITVGGKIQVYGDFVANGNVVCSTVAVEGNATVNEDFEAEQFCINGDLAVRGTRKQNVVFRRYMEA